jgi:hypothetical protein
VAAAPARTISAASAGSDPGEQTNARTGYVAAAVS